MMVPRIETLTEKKLVGTSIRMTLSNDRTGELWKKFMPRRKEIANTTNANLYSLQVYESLLYFKDFNPATEFEKWALAEVSDFSAIPEGMKSYTLNGGLYAVFLHRGTSSDGAKTFQFIFNSWLPNSEYELDNREHFELLGDKYKNNDPNSEEEIWVPVKKSKAGTY